MNTTALKAFAPEVRRQLMEAVARKLDYVLSAQTPDYLTTLESKVSALRKLALEDRAGLIERVAYTWFNRLAALRYLDAKGWHPFRSRVLTSATPAETQPELLKVVRTGALPDELRGHTNHARLNNLLDGQIPSPDPQGEVYRHLVLAVCRFYGALLPNLFERISDETELLLPDDLLTEHSIVQGFRTEISDVDCSEVELLGWLYQFYISEKKTAVMERKTTVPVEDIPAVTQIFTPHWVVRYLIENSLGRLWLLNRPSSAIRRKMPFYIDVEAETHFLQIAKPEELRLIDPACGSGHMLTYAFDLLYDIYADEGYPPSDIPGLILSHNLNGVDVCPRATQLAALALTFKAREKSRRFFEPDKVVQPKILCLEDVKLEEGELKAYAGTLALAGLFAQPHFIKLLGQFQDARSHGSLIQPCVGGAELLEARRTIEAQSSSLGGQLLLHQTQLKLISILRQAETLSKHFSVVVANPPYMGSAAMNSSLRTFVESHYEIAKADTYGAFVERNLKFCLPAGYCGMITIPNWMFLKSFESLRGAILSAYSIESLVHCGRGVWGSDFGSCAFVLKASPPSRRASFRRLFKRQGEVQTNAELEQNFLDYDEYPPYNTDPASFLNIIGAPIAYWLKPASFRAFADYTSIGSVADAKSGQNTGDNARFTRRWFEVPIGRIGFGFTSLSDTDNETPKWYPYNKGGEYRKWYGNQEFVVNWQYNGREVKDYAVERNNGKHWSRYIQNLDYMLREGLTWSFISSSHLGVRWTPKGHLFDYAGCSLFPRDVDQYFLLSFLCSSLAPHFALAVNPTVNYQPGNIASLPIKTDVSADIIETLSTSARSACELARADWDNAETSWGFGELPLLHSSLRGPTLEASWRNWKLKCDSAMRRMGELETANNRLLIAAYELEAELEPEVPEEQITLGRADARKDMASLLSYAIGLTMGRYALERPGLILADSGDTFANYLAKVGKPMSELLCAADENAIIPVLDGEWFDDDIVARTRHFLRVVFGEATLRENLRFIEESLGKDLRKYFLTEFYKDHVQTYKRRPIYWMIQSPRKGFSVLIYLHRYTKDTINLVLNRYLREYEAKMRNRLAHLAQVQVSEAIGARDKTAARKETDKLTKTLRECEEWERDVVLPLAQARIELDLDDGVKVNYLKLGEALAPIPGLAAAEE